MNKNHFPSRTWILAAISFAVVLALAGTLTLVIARGRLSTSAPVDLIPLESTYAGTVKLDWVSPGVYSDTLAQPPGTPPDLGQIDLGLLLHRSQGNLSGYVDLEATLVFTTEHKINTTQAITIPLAVGPQVSGAISGDNWQLESERVSMVSEAGQDLIRQFRLTAVRTGLTTYAGEYRETLWGYGPQPYTIVGEFELALVTGKNLVITNEIYLPVIQLR
jgi:hypothetical protein